MLVHRPVLHVSRPVLLVLVVVKEGGRADATSEDELPPSCFRLKKELVQIILITKHCNIQHKT